MYTSSRGEATVRRVGQCGTHCHRVQHELPMAVVDPLGQSRGAGRVERRRPRVLIEVRERVVGIRLRQQGLVFRGNRKITFRCRRGIAQQHDLLARCDAAPELLDEGQEVAVDQNYVVLGVIDRVQDLLGREARVDVAQHRAHHGHRKEALEIAVGVPVHHGNGVARTHAETGQTRSQPADPLPQLSVGEPYLVGVSNGLLGSGGQTGFEQALDQQRIAMAR